MRNQNQEDRMQKAIVKVGRNRVEVEVIAQT